MNIVYLISCSSFIVGITLFILMWYFEKRKHLILKKRRKCEYAILIPAKNESKVIEGLLKSIKPQVYDFTNTFVIVEDKKDKTCNIVKKYGGNIIVRKDFEKKKRKGYALDEAIKEILKKKKYDLYFIFDADNILDNNFIKEMLETYKKGYDISIGYRNIKNSKNVISVCSGLTFSMINSIINKGKQKINNTITISGTGYYISGNLVNKWKGFPFCSLTEDYELTLYASAHNISTYYNENAIFFDEQPTKLGVSIKQRTRWVKGFFEARLLRLKDIKDDYTKIIGIVPYLFIIFGITLFLIENLIETITLLISMNSLYIYTLKIFVSTLLISYFVLVLFTVIIFCKEKNKLNVSKLLKFKAILYNPLFLASYLICLFRAIFKKDLGWEVIDHTEKEVV